MRPYSGGTPISPTAAGVVRFWSGFVLILAAGIGDIGVSNMFTENVNQAVEHEHFDAGHSVSDSMQEIAVAGQTAGSTRPAGDNIPGLPTLQIDSTGGSTKGGSGSDVQFVAAETQLNGANQASDAFGAVNLATGGRHGNNPFFSPSTGALGLVTGFDVSPLTIAGYVESAWSRLGALNDALTGARPADFHPINGPDGRPSVVNMPQHFWQSNPSVNLRLNGRNESVPMSLDGFRGTAVTLVTDGHRVLAIDPRNNDVWQLQRDTLFGYNTGFSWTRLPRR